MAPNRQLDVGDAPDTSRKWVAADAEIGRSTSSTSLMKHFGMKPRTTEVGAKEQNADIESTNGALKRSSEQALLLRRHRNFESVDARRHRHHRNSREGTSMARPAPSSLTRPRALRPSAKVLAMWLRKVARGEA